jgi:hypothetical protein
MGLSKGDTFETFEDWEKCLAQYEKENFVQFYKRNSSLIESYAKKLTKKVIHHSTA